MCEKCRQQQAALLPEFETILYNESASSLYPEIPWNSFSAFSKKYLPSFASRAWPAAAQSSTAYTKKTAGYVPPETQQVKNAIASGQRNENALSDMLFYKRHPELGGRPLSLSTANFATLSKEWLTIRDTIVRPALQMPAAPVTQAPAAGYNGGGKGKLSLQSILNAITKKGYVIYTKPYQLNIAGVRANTAQPNSFDDTINVFYKDNAGNWQFTSNPATTDPGTYYLNNPMNVNGTAIVVPGQYINSHKIGLHKNEYTALVQQGPVKVTRDFNKDSKLDFKTGREENGVFGINIHKAGTDSKDVNTWSAGCQVFARSADFGAFISLCQKHSSLYGNAFTYTLLEEGDL